MTKILDLVDAYVGASIECQCGCTTLTKVEKCKSALEREVDNINDGLANIQGEVDKMVKAFKDREAYLSKRVNKFELDSTLLHCVLTTVMYELCNNPKIDVKNILSPTTLENVTNVLKKSKEG